MTDDFFGKTGGLMQGLFGFFQEDDPDIELEKARSDLIDLQNEETMLYAEIGKLALARGAGQFPEAEDRLGLVQRELAEGRARLKAAQAAQGCGAEKGRTAKAQYTCPECGYRNLDGVRFCQECGAEWHDG